MFGARPNCGRAGTCGLSKWHLSVHGRYLLARRFRSESHPLSHCSAIRRAAAREWSRLSPRLMSRTGYIHRRTYGPSHFSNLLDTLVSPVLALVIRRQGEMPSIAANPGKLAGTTRGTMQAHRAVEDLVLAALSAIPPSTAKASASPPASFRPASTPSPDSTACMSRSASSCCCRSRACCPRARSEATKLRQSRSSASTGTSSTLSGSSSSPSSI